LSTKLFLGLLTIQSKEINGMHATT